MAGRITKSEAQLRPDPRFGDKTLAVQAIPRVLGDVDVPQLVHDLLAELAEEDAERFRRDPGADPSRLQVAAASVADTDFCFASLMPVPQLQPQPPPPKPRPPLEASLLK